MFVILIRKTILYQEKTYRFYLNQKDAKTLDANSFRILSYSTCLQF